MALALLAVPILSVASDRLPPRPVFLSEITYSGIAPEPFGPVVVTLKMEREELEGLTIELNGTIIEVGDALLEGLTNPSDIDVSYPGSGKIDHITIGFEFGVPYRVSFDRSECEPEAQEIQLHRDAALFTINEQYEVSKRIHSSRTGIVIDGT